MNTRLGVLGVLAILSSVTACSGNGGRAPKIESFSVTPDALPLGGGTVTFTWDTRRAEELSIEPLIGAVTGTSLTIQVTSGGTYTLVAQNNHGIRTAETSLTVGAPVTVVGTVYQQTFSGTIQDYTIVVLGQEWVTPALTGTGGDFVLEGVVPPYDLAVVSPNSPLVVVFRKVTRPDPFVSIPAFVPTAPGPQFLRSATVAGDVSGGATLPLVGGGFLLGAVELDKQGAFMFGGSPADGTWGSGFQWNGTESLDATFHLLQANGPGPLVSYTGYGNAALTVVDQDSLTSQDVQLSSVTTATASGTYSAPLFAPPVIPQVTMARFRAPRAFQDYIGLQDVLPLPMVLSTNETYSVALPEVPGGYFHLYQTYGTPSGSVNHYARIRPGEERTIELPEPVRMALPVDSASVDASTRFAATAPPGVLVEFVINIGPGTISVLTDDPSFTLAELHLEDLGLLPNQLSGGNWMTWSFGFYDSMDDALGVDGSDGDLMLGFPGGGRSFTFEP